MCVCVQACLCVFECACVGACFGRVAAVPAEGLGGDTHADPWVFQSLLGSDPLGGVDGQHLVDQVLGFRSDRVPLRGGELQESRAERGAGDQKKHTHIHSHTHTHTGTLNKTLAKL